MHKRILALSSSRVGNSAYLEKAAPQIQRFLGDAIQSIAFIPFASVDSYDDYALKVRSGLAASPYKVVTVIPGNETQVIDRCGAIMVGGGNTFKLLHDLYKDDLMETIANKVNNGIPYIGWSAGANITGETICTTNDMPVVQPKSFTAFGFFPFQINPHYHNSVVEGFNGETRDQRLEEFLKLNNEKRIVCLPEGTALHLEDDVLRFIGDTPGILLSMHDKVIARKEIQSNADLSFMLYE